MQAGDRILPAFPQDLSARAAASLEALGVEIRLDARVTGITANRVMIGEETIESQTVRWAAGVVASPVANCADAPPMRRSAIAIRAAWRPLAARARSQISAGSSCTARLHGGYGARSMSASWQASATAPP